MYPWRLYTPINSLPEALFTPKQLVERHSWLKLGTLREMLFNRDYNGLAASGAVIVLTSRKILIDEALFVSWVKSHRVTPRK
jgi:hypothetical protein